MGFQLTIFISQAEFSLAGQPYFSERKSMSRHYYQLPMLWKNVTCIRHWQVIGLTALGIKRI